MSSINISQKVAFELVQQAANLFRQGTGIVLAPMDETGHLDRGLIDELDEGSDLRHGVNAFLFFIRTVHGILEHALLNEDMIENG